MGSAEVNITLGHLAHHARQDAPYLFLGAALLTVAMIAVGLFSLRRRRDPLLAYFALFAALYGLRLILQRPTTDMVFLESDWFHRIRDALNYLVPIPAFLFFDRANFVQTRARHAAYGFALVGTTLFVLTLVLRQHIAFLTINNAAVLVALAVLLMDMARESRGREREVRLARFGLVVFAAFAIYDNLMGIVSPRSARLEPIGFVVFLATLGYLTAQRMFQREERLIAIENELEIARRIQFSILPGEFPVKKAFRAAARYVPMTSVAGDFYEFVLTEDDCAGLLIADVSGHGVPAALIASMVKLAAASQKQNAADPAAFLSGMNAALCGNTQSQFVTAAYAYLDSRSRRLTYSAAGHPPVLLVRDGSATAVEENGFMLAAFDSATYSNRVVELRPKDRVLLYTDGVLEACNSAGEFFGAERLTEAILHASALSVDAAAEKIVQEVKQWSRVQEDDITVLLCEFVDQG